MKKFGFGLYILFLGGTIAADDLKKVYKGEDNFYKGSYAAPSDYILNAEKQNWRLVKVVFTSGTDVVTEVLITKATKGTAYIDDTGVIHAKYILEQEQSATKK